LCVSLSKTIVGLFRVTSYDVFDEFRSSIYISVAYMQETYCSCCRCRNYVFLIKEYCLRNKSITVEVVVLQFARVVIEVFFILKNKAYGQHRDNRCRVHHLVKS